MPPLSYRQNNLQIYYGYSVCVFCQKIKQWIIEKKTIIPVRKKRIHAQNGLQLLTTPHILIYIEEKNNLTISVLDDFRPGWSDIDLITLADRIISEAQAEKLLMLRQEMLQKELGPVVQRYADVLEQELKDRNIR